MTTSVPSTREKHAAVLRGAWVAALACAAGSAAALALYWPQVVGTGGSSFGRSPAPVQLGLFGFMAMFACAGSVVLGALAGAVAAQTRSALAGAVAGLVLGATLAACVVATFFGPGGFTLASTSPALFGAAWLALPAAVGGFAAGWRMRAPALPRAVAVARTAPAWLRGPDLANTLARWPLLLLIFVAFALFAGFVLLAVPDLAPWGGSEALLGRAIHVGAMPWSKLALAWAARGGAHADAVLLLAAGLGINATLLAGLAFGLRRTVG